MLVAAAYLLFLAGTKTKRGPLNPVASLVMQQSYLLLGLFLVGKRMSTWKSVERSVPVDLKPGISIGENTC